jgi:hypothetical protein
MRMASSIARDWVSFLSVSIVGSLVRFLVEIIVSRILYRIAELGIADSPNLRA